MFYSNEHVCQAHRTLNPNHIEMGILPVRADNYDFSAHKCHMFAMPHVCNPGQNNVSHGKIIFDVFWCHTFLSGNNILLLLVMFLQQCLLV